MIQQFFVLSNRGDVLINKEFLPGLQMNVTEAFYREVLKEENAQKPAFNFQGANFYYLKRETIYLVVSTLSNDSCLGLISALLKIEAMLQDFCGTLSEDSVRKNFILIYEVLNEMVDFGF